MAVTASSFSGSAPKTWAPIRFPPRATNDSPVTAGAIATTCGMPRITFTACGQFSICFRCRSEEHTSELQSRQYLVCRLLLEKKKQYYTRRQGGNGRARKALPGTLLYHATLPM